MEKISFTVNINTAAINVYQIMLADNTYRKWTAEFNPSSFYEGKWEAGEKMLFVGFNKDGIKEGMVSCITAAVPGKYVSIKHLGLLQGDVEITSGKDVEGWANAMEEYFFTEENGTTTLLVTMDANDAFKSYFEATWPKALNALKQICENN